MTINLRKNGHCKHCGRKLDSTDLPDECEDTRWCISSAVDQDHATREDWLALEALRALNVLSDAWLDRDTAFARSASRDPEARFESLTGSELFGRQALARSAAY